MNKKGLHYFYHILVLSILAYLIIFLKLGSFNMRWWDESMFAVNTYEMMHNGKYFSAYFDNIVDVFNTKPPLTSWCQIIFVKIIGYNELAVRLPSAIAAYLSVIVLFRFILKSFNYIWAWLSALILLTSSGFINFHTARTADSDSLLTFFLLVSNIYFINFILKNRRRDVIYFLIFISLAFATKLYAALLFTPAYFIILLQQRKFKEFIFNRAFIIGILIFISSCGGLIYLRETDTPGYLMKTILYDAGRIFSVMDNHKEYPTFYIDNLFKIRFSIWSGLFVIGSLLIYFSKNKIEKTILFSMLLLIFVYLTILSIAITKLEWYDMPIYPYLSVIAAYPIFLLIQNISINGKSISILPTILLIIAIFYYPYVIMFNKSQSNIIGNGEKQLESNERYIFEKIKEGKNLDGVNIYYCGFKGSLLFYKYKLAEKSQKIEFVNNESFNINDKVLVSDDSLKKILINKYQFSIIDKYEHAELLIIDKLRTPVISARN
jgi:4-amino-4-deoxy-L-arabinose transferase-like glycosyltransferase